MPCVSLALAPEESVWRLPFRVPDTQARPLAPVAGGGVLVREERRDALEGGPDRPRVVPSRAVEADVAGRTAHRVELGVEVKEGAAPERGQGGIEGGGGVDQRLVVHGAAYRGRGPASRVQPAGASQRSTSRTQ